MSDQKTLLIGGSYGGRDAMKYLVPRINGANHTTILLPHIEQLIIHSDIFNANIQSKIIRHGMNIEPGNVYLRHIKNHCEGLSFKNGKFVHKDTQDDDSVSIDYTMSEAANYFGPQCIGVILSGAGADGAIGMKAIKEKQGKTFIQAEGIGKQNNCSFMLMLYNDVLMKEPYRGWYCHDMPSATLRSTDIDFAGSIDDLTNELNKILD